MNFLYFEARCLACGDRDFLEREITGETLSLEKLSQAGLPANAMEEVLICWECLLHFCE